MLCCVHQPRHQIEVHTKLAMLGASSASTSPASRALLELVDRLHADDGTLEIIGDTQVETGSATGTEPARSNPGLDSARAARPSSSPSLSHGSSGSVILPPWRHGPPLTPAGVGMLTEAVRGNSSLIVLDLAGNRIGPAGASLLASAFKTHASLARLLVARNDIGPCGAGEIAAALKRNTSITELALESNQLGDIGVATLADALRSNYALKKLAIGDNGVSAEVQACWRTL